MKQYEKPLLNTFSLSGNEALCACTYDVVGSNADPSMKNMILAGLNAMGYETPNGEIPERLFGLGDNCAEQIDFMGYCKFGPSGEFIFNS